MDTVVTETAHDLAARRVSEFLYARRSRSGTPSIDLAFSGEPGREARNYQTEAEASVAWNALNVILRRRCSVPCIVVGQEVLLQGAHLTDLRRFSDERGHFLVFIFKEKRNIAVGYREISVRDQIYEGLLRMLGVENKPEDGPIPLN